MLYTESMYTVKQLARLAGITSRTLHYYDEISLLKPAHIGQNGYRYYGAESVFRLQQILLYRELGLSLDAIRSILADPGFDLVSALEEHRAKLLLRVDDMKHVILTVEDTILHLKGKKEMSDKQLFEPFSEAQQAKYEKEATRMYDPKTVKASNRKWKSYSKEERQRIGEEGNAAYLAIMAAIPLGPGSAEVQAGVERWRKHMDYFWTPEPEQLLGLVQLYIDDPRLDEFMLAAVTEYVKRLKLSFEVIPTQKSLYHLRDLLFIAISI